MSEISAISKVLNKSKLPDELINLIYDYLGNPPSALFELLKYNTMFKPYFVYRRIQDDIMLKFIDYSGIDRFIFNKVINENWESDDEED